MINFIGTDGYFINLDAIVLVEDVSDGKESKAVITTNAGTDIEITGKDADALFERIEALALEQAFLTGQFRQQIETLRQIGEQQKVQK